MFLLFIVISLVVMIFIYGNIQQDGLVLSIHRNTVNTTARRHKHNSTVTSKNIIGQKMPPTMQKSKDTEHKRNTTGKWTVQDTGVIKEEVLWKTGKVFDEEKKVNVRTKFNQEIKSTFPSLQTTSTISQRMYSSDSTIKLKIDEPILKKTVLTTAPTTRAREKSPKLQTQTSMMTPANPGYTNNYQHFPTFGKKITFYGENYTEAPPDTTPTTTEDIEKLERDLFAALDELAKKYGKEDPI